MQKKKLHILAAEEIKWDWLKAKFVSQSLSDFPPVATFLITSVSCVSLFVATQQAAPCVFSPTCVSSVSCSSPELT